MKKIILVLSALYILKLLASTTMKMKFNPPLSRTVITSKYGNRKNPITGTKEFHHGVDLAAKVGTAIKSPESASVVKIKEDLKGGKQIILRHPKGFKTGYAHLSAILVKVGETLQKGDVFALSGNTGSSTGPHLHMTFYKDDVNINPEKYITFKT